MRGKVKYVTRSVLWVDHTRYTNTYAVLYNEDEVLIDEDEIRSCYDCCYITKDVIEELNNDLHNEWIEYSEDCEGDYCLDGDLGDYI